MVATPGPGVTESGSNLIPCPEKPSWKGGGKLYLEPGSVRWILLVTQAESRPGSWAGSWGCWSWKNCHCWSSARGSPRRARFSGGRGCCRDRDAQGLQSQELATGRHKCSPVRPQYKEMKTVPMWPCIKGVNVKDGHAVFCGAAGQIPHLDRMNSWPNSWIISHQTY